MQPDHLQSGQPGGNVETFVAVRINPMLLGDCRGLGCDGGIAPPHPSRSRTACSTIAMVRPLADRAGLADTDRLRVVQHQQRCRPGAISASSSSSISVRRKARGA
jgi:hypothetical protein